jgi:predicted DNA-binding protein (MmcQ/YjbR family)
MRSNLTHKQVENYILGKPGARLDYPFGEEVAVYKIGRGKEAKMFALITEGKTPIRLSLKCEPRLAETLRAKYESVLPGYHLSKKHWNTIILSGQLSNQEVFDLIDHSYNLVIQTQAKSSA